MAMSAIDGAVMNTARRRSGTPRERRCAGRPAGMAAVSAIGDQKVSNADCMSVCAFFSASSGDICPASAALTFS